MQLSRDDKDICFIDVHVLSMIVVTDTYIGTDCHNQTHILSLIPREGYTVSMDISQTVIYNTL